MPRFKGRDIHEARLVWDPLVHERLYGERCFFYLLRIKNPHVDLAAKFERLLGAAGITSYSIYVLYGYYDLLIRVWATPQRRDDLIANLKGVQDLTEKVQEFISKRVDYAWATNKPGPEVTNNPIPYKDPIGRACRASDGGGEPELADIELLSGAGILHTSAGRDRSSIKFYIAVSSLSGRTHAEQEEQIIAEAAERAETGLRDVSLYHGIGFADYLVEATVADYRQIIQATRRFFDGLKQIEMRMMSLLIANDDAPESDQIDVTWEELPLTLRLLRETLDFELDTEIRALNPEERRVVGGLFDEFNGYLKTPFDRVFVGMFAARLRRDPKLLGERLSFLLELEALLGQYFRDTFVDKLGKQWFREAKRAAGECGVDPQKGPVEDYTLHDWVTVANKLVSDKVIDGAEIEAFLGSGWFAKLDEVKDCRNDLAHGRVFKRDYLRKWADVARACFTVGGMYNGLIARYSEVNARR